MRARTPAAAATTTEPVREPAPAVTTEVGLGVLSLEMLACVITSDKDEAKTHVPLPPGHEAPPGQPGFEPVGTEVGHGTATVS